MKKYVFRICYLLFLAYVPGMLMAEWGVMHYMSPESDSHYNLLVHMYSNPCYWFGAWLKLLREGLNNTFFLPISIFLLFLIYIWIKKAKASTAIILLLVSVFLNPFQSPDQRFIGWMEFGEPFFQPFYF